MSRVLNLPYPFTFGGLIQAKFVVPSADSSTFADVKRTRRIRSRIFQSVNVKDALVLHPFHSSIIFTKSLNR